MILVTGCGSSGTTYIAEVLNTNGLHVTHDNLLGKDGIVTNAIVHDQIWVYNYGYDGIREYVQQKIPITQFNKIIHITRHPLDVIPSILQKWANWGKVWLLRLTNSRKNNGKKPYPVWVWFFRNIFLLMCAPPRTHP